MIVNVRVDVPPIEMEVGLKATATVGSAITVSNAVSGFAPVPPFHEKELVVLGLTPGVVALTLTSMRQVADERTTPLDREIPLLPAEAVTAPPHELVTPAGLPTTNPAGSVSVKANGSSRQTRPENSPRR